MFSTFKATVCHLARTPGIMVWTLVFPVVLSTVFVFMFQNLGNDGTLDAVPVAVVADDAWDGSTFALVVNGLSEGDEPLLDVREVDDTSAAEEIVRAGEASGYYAVDADGEPELVLRAAGSSSSQALRGSILEAVASSYKQSEALIKDVLAENPAALADTGAVASALGLTVGVREVSLTRATPDSTVRYYYALLGMAAMFCANLACYAVCLAQPTTSALGQRRAVAGSSRARQLAGILAGSWLVAYVCLVLAFLYMCYVVGIDFAGREGLCLAGLAASSLLATAVGAGVAALPMHAGSDARSGIITGISCLCSLFAGLYGQAAMELADNLAAAAPASAWVNPVKLVCDLFYSLYYYDDLGPFLLRCGACAGISAALFALAALSFRRQSHEYL